MLRNETPNGTLAQTACEAASAEFSETVCFHHECGQAASQARPEDLNNSDSCRTSAIEREEITSTYQDFLASKRAYTRLFDREAAV